MYCKNCGNPIDENAAVCVKCGCAKGTGLSYCHNCGQPMDPGAAFCTSCGAAPTPANDPNAKSKLAAGLLGIFLGGLGVHNFYLGNTKKAVVQVLLGTVGACVAVGPFISSVWGLVEGIMILCGSINVDGKGNPLKD